LDFDIHQLDEVDPTSDRAWATMERYQKALLQRFYDSPEGMDLVKSASGIGHWVAPLVHFGFSYLGATIPRMTVVDAEEILTELFPRKISLSSPEEADEAIPELSAFWSYLAREYRLPNAAAILGLLKEVQPKFKGMMNDPSKFGMAKSFVTAGQAAGFDMNNEEQIQRFAALYNAGLAVEQGVMNKDHPEMQRSAFSRKQRKKIRKLASQSRRQNRREGR
jgi:hypothetical protein